MKSLSNINSKRKVDAAWMDNNGGPFTRHHMVDREPRHFSSKVYIELKGNKTLSWPGSISFNKCMQ